MSNEMLMRVISGRVLLKEKGRPQRLIEIGDEIVNNDLVDKLISLGGEERPLGAAVRHLEHLERSRMKERLEDDPQLVTVLAKEFGETETQIKKSLRDLLRKSTP